MDAYIIGTATLVIAIIIIAILWNLLVPIGPRDLRSHGHPDGKELYEWAIKKQQEEKDV